MRKIIIFLLLTGLILLYVFNRPEKNEKIIVSEVTHSVFYAPWYVSLNNGYFDNLNIEVVLGNGANNVISSLLSDSVNIGLCGAEATIYVNNELDDKIKSFSALTKKDGQFIVLKNNVKYNNINDLEGLTILSGRSGGMPLLSFKTALENNQINNVNIDSSVEFANLSSAFISSEADGVNLFEPNATNLVKNGYGYIADMVGNYAGILPYTTFVAKESYIKSHEKEIKKFYDGINKGLEFVNTHSPEDIAKIIINEFPDTSLEDLTIMIKNYKDNDSWFSSATLNEDAFNNLENILINNDLIEDYFIYSNLVYEIN